MSGMVVFVPRRPRVRTESTRISDVTGVRFAPLFKLVQSAPESGAGFWVHAGSVEVAS